MNSEKYRDMLIIAAQKLDQILRKKSQFEVYVENIIAQNNDEEAVLNFINHLGNLKSEHVDFEQTQRKMIELLYLYFGSQKIEGMYHNLKENKTVPLEKLQGELNKLVGLSAVKEQINSLILFNKIQRARKDAGLKLANKTLHMAFLGNPGTAKTTVARIVGKMYKSLGLLSKGHFIEASRTDLIAEYQGQTAIKVRKLIERAKGGVLFIDEAYSITENENSDSYGRECLTELTKALEDYRDDLVVIVAGYANLMENFFASNPGLKSRFNTFIDFQDYTLDELVEIFKFECIEYEYVIDDEAMAMVKTWLANAVTTKDEHFSNGRTVRNLFDDVVMKQSKRLAMSDIELMKAQLSKIELTDIPASK